MDFTIYNIGSQRVLYDVLNGMAMIVNSANWWGMAAIAMGFAILANAIIGLTRQNNSIMSPFVTSAVSILLFCILFVPTTRVHLEDLKSGEVRTIDNIPIGVAAIGGITSTFGMKMTEIMEAAFSAPTITENGFMKPIMALAAVRTFTMNQLGLQNISLPQGKGDDISRSWTNYVRDCTSLGMIYGGRGVPGTKSSAEVLVNEDVFEALKFDSPMWSTEIYVKDASSSVNPPYEYTCREAWPVLVAATDETYFDEIYKNLQPYVSTRNEIATGTADPKTLLENATHDLLGAGVDAQKYMTAVTLLPLFQEGVVAGHQKNMMYSAAQMDNEAIQQRNAAWTSQGNQFLRTAPKLLGFIEALFYALSPFAAILCILSVASILSFFKFAFFIQLWYPIMAIINLITVKTMEGTVADIQLSSGLSMSSMNGILQLDSILQDNIAIGAWLIAFTPVIAWGIVSGLSNVASGVGNAISAAAERHTSPGTTMAPGVSSVDTTLKVGSQYKGSVSRGAMKDGAESLLSNANIKSDVAMATKATEARQQQATMGFKSDLSKTFAQTSQHSISSEHARSLGKSMRSSNSSAYNFLSNKIRAASGGQNISVGTMDQLVGQLTYSGGVAGGLKGSTGKKPGEGISGGGTVSITGNRSDSTTQSQGQSVTTGIIDNILSSGSESLSADLMDAITSDAKDGIAESYLKQLSNSDSHSLSKSASELHSVSQNHEKAQSISHALSSGMTPDAQILANRVANSAAYGNLVKTMQFAGLNEQVSRNAQTLKGQFLDDKERHAAAMLNVAQRNMGTDTLARTAFYNTMSYALGLEGDSRSLTSVDPGKFSGIGGKAPGFGDVSNEVTPHLPSKANLKGKTGNLPEKVDDDIISTKKTVDGADDAVRAHHQSGKKTAQNAEDRTRAEMGNRAARQAEARLEAMGERVGWTDEVADFVNRRAGLFLAKKGGETWQKWENWADQTSQAAGLTDAQSMVFRGLTMGDNKLINQGTDLMKEEQGVIRPNGSVNENAQNRVNGMVENMRQAVTMGKYAGQHLQNTTLSNQMRGLTDFTGRAGVVAAPPSIHDAAIDEGRPKPEKGWGTGRYN